MAHEDPIPPESIAGDLSGLPAKPSPQPSVVPASSSIFGSTEQTEFDPDPPPTPDVDELFDALETVHDEESFRQFLLALRDDRERSVEQERLTPSHPYGPEAGGWENTTIERFFDAAATWAKVSVNGTASYTKSENPWRRCADILYVGKIYE